MIERYLDELSRHLHARPWRRRRILAEVEAHLLDAGGDEDAIARFGSPEEVAARFNEVMPPPRPRLAALAVLAGIAVVFGAVQGLEDHIPPAPWPEDAAPANLETIFTLATSGVFIAIALALAALLRGRRGDALAACAALAVTVLLLAVHAFRRAELVPGSPPSWQLLLVTIGALTPPLAGAALTLRRAR
ncbi:MAG: hypothetical protein H0V45_03625 [Actinobacteria bacterium]|nr:hypothetical protein [Actinomycetota bacterium]